ncbi:hypothetical protein [Sinorhizobium medicae]
MTAISTAVEPACSSPGKDNYRQYRNWCRAAGLDYPDFVKDPDAVNADPWEGLVPLFYWDTRELNRWAG